jgi:septal ring factor EnvC (AmiA/AmiB activator)
MGSPRATCSGFDDRSRVNRRWLSLTLLLLLAAAPADDVAETRRQLAAAQAEGAAAQARAVSLEADAARATEAADKTARDAAAVAARIQQAEADIAADEAQARLIAQRREALRARLAAKQLPLVRLTAALQRISRRPMVVALLRPGSIADVMHMRALIATMIPEVRARTADLTAEIARGRALQAEAEHAAAVLRAGQAELGERRATLTALETRQRLAARKVNGSADREAERALALAEQARDLGTLVQGLGQADALRAELAALPGPVIRPAHGGIAAEDLGAPAAPQPTGAPSPYMLPAAGRLVTGFGGMANGAPSRGIALAVRGGALAVAPAAGRVAFAGPYRGYGEIVILTHDGGWTSLVTGLARADVAVGDVLVAGAPLGSAGPGSPVLTLELRKDGTPVNPLDALKR